MLHLINWGKNLFNVLHAHKEKESHLKREEKDTRATQLKSFCDSHLSLDFLITFL